MWSPHYRDGYEYVDRNNRRSHCVKVDEHMLRKKRVAENRRSPLGAWITR